MTWFFSTKIIWIWFLIIIAKRKPHTQPLCSAQNIHQFRRRWHLHPNKAGVTRIHMLKVLGFSFFEQRVLKLLSVCMCVCATMKKVPDEWQACVCACVRACAWGGGGGGAHVHTLVHCVAVVGSLMLQVLQFSVCQEDLTDGWGHWVKHQTQSIF